MADHVLISEVGPRDGWQNARGRVSAAQKCAWIDALRAAGVREIEVGSFVPPKLLPQMAARALLAAGMPDEPLDGHVTATGCAA